MTDPKIDLICNRWWGCDRGCGSLYEARGTEFYCDRNSNSRWDPEGSYTEFADAELSRGALEHDAVVDDRMIIS